MYVSPTSLVINDQDLKGELVKIASELSSAIFNVAQAKKKKLEIELQVKQLRAITALQLYAEAEHTGTKMTEKRLDVMLSCSSAVVALDNDEMVAASELIDATAILDTLTKKKDLLMTLSNLTRSELGAMNLAT